MHEFSIATSVVDMLLELAQKRGIEGKLLEVHLRVGKLRAISIEQLKFSYQVLAKGKFLYGSRLIVEESPAIVHCPKCGFREDFRVADDSYHLALPNLSCPKCATNVAIEGGDEVMITKLRLRRASKKLRRR
jgi:hydrogenase nickel insertion protein HypA